MWKCASCLGDNVPSRVAIYPPPLVRIPEADRNCLKKFLAEAPGCVLASDLHIPAEGLAGLCAMFHERELRGLGVQCLAGVDAFNLRGSLSRALGAQPVPQLGLLVWGSPHPNCCGGQTTSEVDVESLHDSTGTTGSFKREVLLDLSHIGGLRAPCLLCGCFFACARACPVAAWP